MGDARRRAPTLARSSVGLSDALVDSRFAGPADRRVNGRLQNAAYAAIAYVAVIYFASATRILEIEAVDSDELELRHHVKFRFHIRGSVYRVMSVGITTMSNLKVRVVSGRKLL